MVFIIEKFEMIEGNLLKRTQKMIKAWADRYRNDFLEI